MTPILTYVAPPMAGLVTCLVLTPIVRSFALRIGAVDRPAARRVHDGEVARLGGVAVYSSFWLGVAIYLAVGGRLGCPTGLLATFAVGSLGLVAIGVYDDVRDSPAWLRLVFQLVAGHLAWQGGFRFAVLTGAMTLALPDPAPAVLEYGLTVLWVAGVTNAINFMDGLDFLCAGFSLVAVGALAAVAVVSRQLSFVPLYLALAAVLVAFGQFNRWPASIFMGDSGSTFLG
ncbi:MAG: undecaprenyl/decaprenyl-phosphate alpha-N-acetylglucosaminyl 1-phosphate transferase, partial [Candidatus Riflebacteria bacterium]|nr:undecaprenyl/decaprenyl-phosphate alpha-N-acetylglucosaminyl 1-phosphate transferase [Candidatus Riflebacteria bacterium]